MSTIKTENFFVLNINGTDYKINTPTSYNSAEIKTTLKKLTFDKGVYRPGEIFAVFSVPASMSYSDLKNLFLESSTHMRRYATLKFIKKTTEKTVSTEETDNGKSIQEYTSKTETIIADNYYVFKMKPIFKRSSNNTMQTVELTICSEDIQMTLEKYCKAYTGRKLGSYIYTDGLGLFSVKTNKDTISDDLKVIKYLRTVTEKTKDENGKETEITKEVPDELIQPYLVQYNESFYDFLKRTANRCGEFLYHENGKLYLGMEVNDKTDTDYGKIASEYYYEDILQKGPVLVSDYAYNYMSSNSPRKVSYDNPLATDEYLDKIPKDYTSYSAQMYLKDRDAVSYVCSALQCSTLGEIGGTLAFQGTFQAIGAAVKEKQLNDTNKQTNIDSWDDDNHKEMWTLDNSGNTDELRQFGTGVDQKSAIDTGVTNLYAKFYDLVRQRQEEACKNAVFLDFKDNPQDLKIGDLIKVGTNDYLVIEVKGSQELVDGSYEIHQQVVGIHPYNKGNETKPDYVPIPPRLSNLVIRESQAQHATVAVNFDPKKIGRVRVRFAWQTSSDDASPWIRVAMPFATDGGGVKFRPIVGDEVMISFINGNVEHPYVTGFLLNKSCNDAWASLPDRTITSKNGHNITFTDGVDGSNFFLNMTSFSGMIKSFIPTTDLPAKFDTAGGLALTGGTTISDRYKLYQITMSTDNRSILIKSAMGDVSINAFTGINITAPNGNINIAGKNVSISASNKVNITSGTALKKRFFPDSGLGDNHPWYEKAGFSTFKAFPDFFITAFDTYAQKLANKFIDFSFFRSLIELFTRPIDGTTRIKSFTFVELEAGKGSTDYPEGVKKSDDTPFYPKLDRSINAISAAVDSRINAIYPKYVALETAINAFKALSADNKVNKDGQVLSFEDIKTAGNAQSPTHYSEQDLNFKDWAAGDGFDEDAALAQVNEDMKKTTNAEYEFDHEPTQDEERYKDNLHKFELEHELWRLFYEDEVANPKRTYDTEENRKKQDRTNFVKAANDLIDAFSGLKKALEDAKADVDRYRTFEKEDKNAVSETFDELGLLEVKDIPDDFQLSDITTHFGAKMADAKKKWKRKAVYHMLAATKDKNKVTTNCTAYVNTDDVMTNWDTIVNGFFIEEEKPDMTKFKDNIISFSKEKFKGDWKNWWESSHADPWLDATISHRRWKTGFSGKILMSESADKTIKFNANGNGIENYTNQKASNKSIDLFKNKLKALK